jgi:hypothetical protein
MEKPGRLNPAFLLIIEFIDVLLTVETTVQNDIDFLVVHDIEFMHQLLDVLYICDVAGTLSIIEGQSGFLFAISCKYLAILILLFCPTAYPGRSGKS